MHHRALLVCAFRGGNQKQESGDPAPVTRLPGNEAEWPGPTESQHPPLRDPWGSCLQAGLLDTGATPNVPCPCSHGHTGSPAAHSCHVVLAGQPPPGCSISSSVYPSRPPPCTLKG